MKKNLLSILPVLLLFFQACATVKPPIVKVLPQTVPQESKILENPERFLKRKVAIARFSNETKYGQGFFADPNEDRLGKQAMDIFAAKLAATEKFVLLERIDLAHLNKEKEMTSLTELNIPADYLILGSVSEFGRKTTSEVGLLSRTKKQTAYAKVNVRLVDVKTSQIIYSEEGEGEAYSEAGTVLGVGSTAEYDASLNDKVISAAIAKLVNNISEKLLDKAWKSYLLSYEQGSYIIAGGALQGIKENDVFVVYKRGKKINNPQTGIPVELPGKEVGRIKVESLIKGEINSELSVCIKVSGELPETDFTDYYIQEK